MPLSDLNKIDISGWKDNPNVSVQIGHEIEKASWEESKFTAIMGKGENRGIRTYNAPRAQPYSPRLKTALTGDGVVGNADFATNMDNLEILSQVVVPRVIGNAVKSEIKKYQTRDDIDFIKESADSLKVWIEDRRDRNLFAALANDITNCVVCDKDSGFKDTKACASVKFASKKIVADDVMNVKAIQRAILMAKTGLKYNGKDAFAIKPIKSSTINDAGLALQHHSYVILLDSYQIHQLRSDPEWKDMQKSAPRSENHRVFTGFAGMIDGCPIIDMGTWTTMSAGMLNSTISDEEFKKHINPENFKNIVAPSSYAKTQPVSIGYLIGAGALIMAGADTTEFYIDETADAGRKVICGVDKLLAISKGRFEAHASGLLSAYADTDYAVIGIFSSMQ